jgi:cobalt-zinc-cadmium efflux system membrane fusion protein
MSIHRYLIAVLFLLLIVMFSCNPDKGAGISEEKDSVQMNIVSLTAQQAEAVGITLGRVEQKRINSAIKVNGVLDVPPQQLVSISSPYGGFLKATTLLQGSPVAKGQLVATIENFEFIQFQQDYLEAKGNYELAKADYERQQQLAKERVNAEKTLQQSKASFLTWSARFSGLREKLKVLNMDLAAIEAGNFTSTIRLYSPIHGYVTSVNVNIGKFVNPTDVLFEIVDTEHLHAELTLFEKDVPKIRIGQKVRFTLANESTERTATVYLIGREISADRTVRIHCHIDKEDKEMLPGMYLMAVVETGGADVPALPEEAIVDYQGKQYVFTGAGQKSESSGSDKKLRYFNMVEVKTGNIEFGYVEITGETSEDLANEQIVVKGAYALLSKMKNVEQE